MAFDVICGACGNKNPIGRIFCVHCGAKLDLDRSRKAARSSGGLIRALNRGIRFLVAAALLIAIIMALRPAVPTGSDGTLQDAQRLRQKLGLLKGAALDGRAISQNLSELEINGYLAELVTQVQQAESDRYRLRRINMAMGSGRIVVLLATSIGPMALTYELTGTPSRGADRRFAFALHRVRLGHLPMPGAMGNWLAGRAYSVFSRMEDERDLLDRMDAIEVGQGELAVRTRGQP
jgi:hypothetical protein